MLSSKKSKKIYSLVEAIFKGNKTPKDLTNHLNSVSLSPIVYSNDNGSLLNYVLFNYNNQAVFHINNKTKNVNIILLDIVKAILKSNNHYLFPNNEGENPLMIAAQEGLDDIIKLFCRKNIHLLYQIDTQGNNVFHYSVKYKDSHKTVKILKSLDKSTNPNSMAGNMYLRKNLNGDKPKDIAKNQNFKNSEKLL